MQTLYARAIFTPTKMIVQIAKSTSSPQSSLNRECLIPNGKCGISTK